MVAVVPGVEVAEGARFPEVDVDLEDRQAVTNSKVLPAEELTVVREEPKQKTPTFPSKM